MSLLARLFGRDIDSQQVLREVFNSFPDRIDGARAVRKYAVEGARYCLVHVLQMHEKANFSYRPKINDDEMVRAIQLDINQILTFLATHQSVDEVYMEGVSTEERIDEIAKKVQEGVLRVRANRLPYAFELHNKGVITLLPAEDENLREILSTLPDTLTSQFINYTVGVCLGYIQPKAPLTDLELGLLEIFTEQREDVLLTKIARRGKPFGTVVFGASHTWGGSTSCGKNYSSRNRIYFYDNISKWNNRFPRKKFSLIEVVPTSLNLVD